MSKLTLDQHRARLTALGLELLDQEVQGVHTKINVRGTCGHTWSATPHNLYGGSGCPICYENHRGDCLRIPTEEHRERLAALGITLLDECVVGVMTPTKVRWPCGHITTPKLNNVYNGSGCVVCRGKKTTKRQTLPVETHRERLAALGYELIDQDVPGVHSKVAVRGMCGHVWPASLHDIYQGYGCPICNESKGEKVVSATLLELGISFIRQATVLIGGKHRAFFDFWLPDLNVLIEYHGEQHYLSIDHFGGVENLKRTETRDKRKAEYAQEHGYSLIVVPYWIAFSAMRIYLIDQLRAHGVTLKSP